MLWTYRLRCLSGPRLMMRVAQLFDQQGLNIESFSWLLDAAGEFVVIELSVRCGAALAHRLQAKLLHLQDVCEADLREHAATPGTASARLRQVYVAG